MKKFENYYKWITAFIFGVALIAVYKTFDNLSNITKYIGVVIDAVSPFILAFVIAYLLNVPAMKIQKLLEKTRAGFVQRHAFVISIALIYVIAIAVVAAVLWMLIPAISRNIVDLYNNSSYYISAIENFVNNFEIAQKLNIDIGEIIKNLFDSLGMLKLEVYVGGVYNVTSGIVDVFVGIAASVYMLLDKERLQRGIARIIKALLKEEKAQSLMKHARRINDIFMSYIYSRATCSVIMAVAASIVLMLMKVKYGLVLGIFVGAMDMIPYFGSIIATVVAIAVTLLTGGFWKGVWTAVALIVLQQIDGNLIGPRVMGNSLEIRPLWIIFAVSVGGTLFGFLGMLLSVPVLAVIKAVMIDLLEIKEAKVKAADNE